jgi:peptidoglycan/LPS O-acetylase OafA/YrhL
MRRVWVVQHPDARLGRVLNTRVAVHLGLISYSLYLWQQLFLMPQNRSWTGRFPVNLLCALAAAEASYFLIERTFLSLRRSAVRRYGRRRTDLAGTINAAPALSHGIDSDRTVTAA